MPASPLKFLRAGPPPPKVALLPDGLFFTRAVPIAPGATEAEAAQQIELALEAMSPFPLSQLYYGSYWVSGAAHAFVYAAYRRRFTTDQTLAWGEAELVAPASAALFGGNVQPATTIVLTAPEGVTAIHWETADVPSRVVFRPLAPEASDEDRARLRDDIIRDLGGSKAIVDLLVPPAAEPGSNDREIVFRSGDFVSRLAPPAIGAVDVRDKAELTALRASRKRDLVLWRLTLGCAAALILLGLSEVALLGGQAWQKTRMAKLNSRAPAVDSIKQAQELATNIEDLVTKRFLPLEMITSVVGANAERKPADLVITRITSNAATGNRGTYSLVMEIQTTNSAQVPVYRNELQKLPECESVNVEPLPSQGDRSMFRVTVTFKPGALKPQAA